MLAGLVRAGRERSSTSTTATAPTGAGCSTITRALRDHGLLHGENGRPVFAFIHGNWVLETGAQRA
jgi:hypothetical protein